MYDPLAIPFRRNAVEPIECIKRGWDLVKPNYWLMFGISAVGLLIGSFVPLGILLGPMMCGIYLALFSLRRNRPIEFGTLFKGFDYFGDAVVATLLHMVPVFVIFIPSYIIFYAVMILFMARSGGGEPDPNEFISLIIFFAIFWLIVMIILLVLSVVFTFAYPLIVDRRLSGMNAVKLSIKAAFANFWRLLGLVLLNGLLTFVGILFCYVGALFVLPITFGALANAYEQVFGLGEEISNVPPPPPTFA